MSDEQQPIETFSGPNLISAEAFRDGGYLQEVNRQFFHPLGLALQLTFDEGADGPAQLACWDYRDHPEGILYAQLDPATSREKAGKVFEAQRAREDARRRALGYVVQPVEKLSTKDGK